MTKQNFTYNPANPPKEEPTPEEKALTFWSCFMSVDENLVRSTLLGSAGFTTNDIFKLHTANPSNAFFIFHHINKIHDLIKEKKVPLNSIIEWASIPSEPGKSSVNDVLGLDTFNILKKGLDAKISFNDCLKGLEDGSLHNTIEELKKTECKRKIENCTGNDTNKDTFVKKVRFTENDQTANGNNSVIVNNNNAINPSNFSRTQKLQMIEPKKQNPLEQKAITFSPTFF